MACLSLSLEEDFLFSSAPCYSPNETLANVTPRKIFLLHFKESHPIHQHRKKCGNYWEKFMRPQGGRGWSWSSIFGRKKIDLLSGCERCLAVKKFFVWKSLCHLKTKATHDLKVFSRGKEALDVKITAKKYIEAIVIDAPAQVKRNFKLMIRRSPFSTLRKFDPRQLHESESL